MRHLFVLGFLALVVNLFGITLCQKETTKVAAVDSKVLSPLVRYGQWGPWSSCSRTCGLASRRRVRHCYTKLTNTRVDRKYCSSLGPYIQIKLCSLKRCPCTHGRTVYNKCGDRCICVNGRLTKCTRIRKEFTSMTTAERKRYVKIIKTASTNPSYKPQYDTLITIHKTFFQQGIHTTDQFLPWHRWYLLKYENLLRKVDCRFTVAYWDYVAHAGMPFATSSSDLWYSGLSGFGGNGVATSNRCVKNGPFRQNIWSLVPSANPQCLRREFFGNPPGEVDLALLMGLPHTSFTSFESLLSGPFHDNIHCLIGGTMCSFDAAAAPEFFLVHGMVDKIWEDWQKQSSLHRTVHFNNLLGVMTGTGTMAKYYLHSSSLPGGIRVEYREIGDSNIYNVYRTLRRYSRKQLQSIPRERSTPMLDKTIKLFRVSKSKLRKIKEMEELIRPRVVRRVPASAAPIDKKLGFDHKVVSQVKSVE